MRRPPHLLAQSLALVWAAGRPELIVLTLLQLLQGAGVVAQLLMGRWALESMLAAGEGSGHDFTTVVPALILLVSTTVVLNLFGALQTERSEVLGELVARAGAYAALFTSQAAAYLASEDPRDAWREAVTT